MGQKLQRLQTVVGMEEHVRAFVETIRDKVDILDEQGRRLLEIILKDVTCHGDHAVVRTVISPLDKGPSGQLDASPQGGHKGVRYSPNA